MRLNAGSKITIASTLPRIIVVPSLPRRSLAPSTSAHVPVIEQQTPDDPPITVPTRKLLNKSHSLLLTSSQNYCPCQGPIDLSLLQSSFERAPPRIDLRNATGPAICDRSIGPNLATFLPQQWLPPAKARPLSCEMGLCMQLGPVLVELQLHRFADKITTDRNILTNGMTTCLFDSNRPPY